MIGVAFLATDAASTEAGDDSYSPEVAVSSDEAARIAVAADVNNDGEIDPVELEVSLGHSITPRCGLILSADVLCRTPW